MTGWPSPRGRAQQQGPERHDRPEFPERAKFQGEQPRAGRRTFVLVRVRLRCEEEGAGRASEGVT
jgi:hypothetical protein